MCDFDGTISAIVDDPGDAVALPGSLEALRSLSTRVGCVAIISGRPVAWLARQLAAIADAPIELHGMYGMESWSGDAAVVLEEAARWRAVIDAIAAAAHAEAPETVLVEPKGLSVGLHYRENPTDETWVMTWARQQVATLGVSLLTGRCAVELRPPIERDKGHAAAELLDRQRPSTALFLGDDTGDVPVAVALRSTRTARAPTRSSCASTATRRPTACGRWPTSACWGPGRRSSC